MTQERTPIHQKLFQQSPVGMVIYDRELRIIDVNAAFANMIHSDRERITGLCIDDLRDQRHRTAVEAALEGETRSYDSPYQATTSEAWPWLSATFAPIRNVHDDVVAAMVMVSQHPVEKPSDAPSDAPLALSQLSDTQRFGHIGSWTYDAARGRIAGTHEFYRILGLKPDEQSLELTKLASLIHPDDWEEAFAQLAQIIDRQVRVGTHEFRIVRSDGGERWVALRLEAAFDVEPKLVSAWGLLQDVTERRVLEEKLRHAQKMQAMGQLAAGVAHEFNNLLMVIHFESELLADHADDRPSVQEPMRAIRTAASRATDLARELLAFSRKQVPCARVVEVNDSVAGATQMLRRFIGPDVELVTELAPHLPPILADTGQLSQVLMNLAMNARDAMPDGGVLSISTGALRVDDRHTAGVLPLGDYVTVTVRDTGVGMDEATRSRIFEPFFTTKPPDRGTGLGLSIVQGIVEQLGARIAVTSEPGKGSTFTLYFVPQKS